MPVVNVAGIKPGELTLDGDADRRDLPGRDHQLERSADQGAEPERQAARHGDRAGLPLRRLGHELPVHRLPVQGRARSSTRRSARNTSVQWPVGIGAKGNEGVANMVKQTHGAIGYVEYAYAKQNKMTYAKLHQQGRQGRRAESRGLPGRRRQRRLGKAPGLLPDPHQPAGRRQLADHRRQLHPDAQAAARPEPRQDGAQVLRLGLQERRRDGRRARLRADARRAWSSWSRRLWTSRSSRAAASRSEARRRPRSRSDPTDGPLAGRPVRTVNDGTRSMNRRLKPASSAACVSGAHGRRQRLQDRLFRRPTLFFALLVPGAPGRRHRLADRRRAGRPSRTSASASCAPRSGTRSPRSSAPWRRSTARWSPR